jgi:hypothetical protein
MRRTVATATASIRMLSDSFAIPQLGRTRRIWLYLPPDYASTHAEWFWRREFPATYRWLFARAPHDAR